MGRRGPANGLSVPAGNKVEALAAGGRTVIGCILNGMVQLISHALDAGQKAAPGLACPLGIRHKVLLLAWHPLPRLGDMLFDLGLLATLNLDQLDHPAGGLVPLGDEGPPGAHLLDVLHGEHGRFAQGQPLGDHPGQAADLLLARLAAGGLGVMSAIRASMQPTDRATRQHGNRIHGPDIFLQMQGLRVVCLVHGERLGVVIDGDVHRASQPTFYPRAGATAASEQVHVDGKLQVERGPGHLGPDGTGAAK